MEKTKTFNIDDEGSYGYRIKQATKQGFIDCRIGGGQLILVTQIQN